MTTRGLSTIRTLRKRLRCLKSKLDEVGYGVNVGFGWSWLHELPTAEEAPWQFMVAFQHDATGRA